MSIPNTEIFTKDYKSIIFKYNLYPFKWWIDNRL